MSFPPRVLAATISCPEDTCNPEYIPVHVPFHVVAAAVNQPPPSKGESDRTPPITPAVWTEPPSPADARVPGDPPSTPYRASGFGRQQQQKQSSSRTHSAGRTGEENAEETSFKHALSLGKGATCSGSISEPAMPACFQSFLFSDGESGSGSDSSGPPSSASSTLSTKIERKKTKAVGRGCSLGGRPCQNNLDPAALDADARAVDNPRALPVGYLMRVAGGLKTASSRADTPQDSREHESPPPPPPPPPGTPPTKTTGSASGRTGDIGAGMESSRALDNLPTRNKLFTRAAATAALSQDRHEDSLEKQRWKVRYIVCPGCSADCKAT